MRFYGQTFTELQPEINFDPRSGYSVARRWQGSHDEIETAALIYRESGYRTEPQHPENGGYSSLRVYFSNPDGWPDDRPLSDKFTLKGNDLEKTLWHLPNVKAAMMSFVDKFGLAEAIAFRNDVESFVKGETETTVVVNGVNKKAQLTLDYIMGVVADARAHGADITVDLIQGLIEAFARGEDSFPVSQTVLMRTLIVHGNSTIDADTENIDKIFTTTGLKATLPIPNRIKRKMREGFWLKKTPTDEQVGSDKFEINYEWWFAEQYDRFIYGEPVL